MGLLLSSPASPLSDYVAATTTLGDRTVDGSLVLPWNGRAYELELDIVLSQQVHFAEGGTTICQLRSID